MVNETTQYIGMKKRDTLYYKNNNVKIVKVGNNIFIKTKYYNKNIVTVKIEDKIYSLKITKKEIYLF